MADPRSYESAVLHQTERDLGWVEPAAVATGWDRLWAALESPAVDSKAIETSLYRGDWLTDCGNDCRGPEGHREGCPTHCYCYDD